MTKVIDSIKTAFDSGTSLCAFYFFNDFKAASASARDVYT